MKGIIATLAAIWRLSIPYYRSEDRWPGRLLLGSVIAIELALVALTVILNQWYNRFYNTLQDRDWSAFVSALTFFCVIAAINTVLVVYRNYLNQWLQIRWRRWMTQSYMRHWLTAGNHYRMQLLGDAADNPDQRIAEDVKMFISDSGSGVGILPIGIGLLSSTVTLGSFVVILWRLSASAPLTLFGIGIPGYLVWAALLYSVLGTALTHLIGRPLTPLRFTQQRFEADFRFNLVRTRENSEQVAVLHAEPAERERHLNRFGLVVANWIAIMKRQKRLSFFTQSFGQAAVVFPYIMVSPAYFAGAMQLGGLMQTASAFGTVRGALSYFVDAYMEIAEFRAVVQRLSGFEKAIAAARDAALATPVVEVARSERAAGIALDQLKVRLPGGEPLISADGVTFRRGERVLVTGPSGTGKSTLFRAIAGVWPFGSGRVTVPADASLMLLPQRPYFPIGTLASAISYPAKSGTFDEARLANALEAVGLGEWIRRLDEEGHWNRMPSVGEQQRLAIARALLHAPDYLFLDEATASLDEPAEAQLYRMLLERLNTTTLVSIGHRSTLGTFHGRRLALVVDGATHELRDLPLVSAAE